MLMPALAPAEAAPVRQALLDCYENERFTHSMDFDRIADVYQFTLFPSLRESVLAVVNGDVDYVNLPAMTADYVLAHNDWLESRDTDGQISFYMATKADDAALRDALNEGLLALRTDGTLDALAKAHLETPSVAPVSGDVPFAENAPLVRIGVTGDLPPMDCLDDGGLPAGYNVALLSALVEKMHVNFELVEITTADRVEALDTGSVDALFYTAGHEQTTPDVENGRALLTESYYVCGVKRVCRAGESGAVNEAVRNIAAACAARGE